MLNLTIIQSMIKNCEKIILHLNTYYAYSPFVARAKSLLIAFNNMYVLPTFTFLFYLIKNVSSALNFVVENYLKLFMVYVNSNYYFAEFIFFVN